MTSLLSRIFGSRTGSHVCQGKTEYNPEYELLCTEFLDRNKIQWPSKYATTLLKTRLQPILSEPSFKYPSEDTMVRVRGLTLQLWEAALKYLQEEDSGNGPDSQRLLEALILSIAQREEFRVEYLGWQRAKPKKRSYRKGKTSSSGNNSNGNNSSFGRSVSVGVVSMNKKGKRGSASPRSGPKSGSFNTAKDRGH